MSETIRATLRVYWPDGRLIVQQPVALSPYQSVTMGTFSPQHDLTLPTGSKLEVIVERED